MEIWLGAPVGWFPDQGKAQVFGTGEGPISYISRDDVGSWAVVAIKESRTENQVIPLGGPRAVSPNEAVRIFEQAIGKPLKVTRVPGFVPKMAGAVLKPFNPKMASLMALGAQTLGGDVVDMSKARSLAQVPETSIEDYARKVAANLTA